MRYLLMNPLKMGGLFCSVEEHQATFWSTWRFKVATLLIAYNLVINFNPLDKAQPHFNDF